jgi:hypothetical protein
MRNYEIITTLGPASDVEAVWFSMQAAGGTGFRLNTFHLELGQLWAWLERLEPCSSVPASHVRLSPWICRAASGGRDSLPRWTG